MSTSPADSVTPHPGDIEIAPSAPIVQSQRSAGAISHEELVDALEGMNDGFMVLDRELRITYVNGAAERTNGTTRENLVGRIFWEAFPAVLGTEFERGLRRAMAERVSVRGEAFYQPYVQWFEMDIHPIRNGG